MSLMQKTLFLATALGLLMFGVVVVDAATGERPSCSVCVEPAPHAWDVKGTP